MYHDAAAAAAAGGSSLYMSCVCSCADDGGSRIAPAAQLVAQLAPRFKKGYLPLVAPNHLLLLRLLQEAS